jgi:pyruvate dehydrogenase E2 component (dihydrolipoamide acetyltransferase)
VSKQQVTVPDIGGAENAEVIEVLVAVGDEVTVDQGLIVLESDKASMEIPSTVAGTVVELLVEIGQQLAEGAPVAVIEAAQGSDSTTQETISTAVAQEPADAGEAGVGSAGEGAAEPAQASAPHAGSEQTVSVPDIGTDEAVELIEVCVAVGDTVVEGDSLVALESDKASMEVPAPFGGEVIELLVKSGDQVRQGDKLMVLRGDSAAAEQVPESESAPPPAPTPAPSTPSGRETGAGDGAAVMSDVKEARSAGTSGTYAGPAVRKLAREFGVSLQQVSGSGPRGRILKEDLQQYVQKALGKQPAGVVAGAGIPAIPEIDFAKFGPVELTDRSKLDKLTAANMHRSWLNVPHVTQFDEADITALEAFRAGLKPEAEQRGTRLTPMPFILKACAVALRDNPKFNSSLAAGGEQLAQKGYIHIGMAVDTPAGLVVPVIRDVDKKTIWELAAEVLALAAKARDRKLSPGDMQGGCFTVSSLGNIGGNGFTPIVNAPEVGILGVSRAAIKPVWDGREFAPRTLLPLALSYDHRVINGGDGGRFMTQLVALLGDIRQLLM